MRKPSIRGLVKIASQFTAGSRSLAPRRAHGSYRLRLERAPILTKIEKRLATELNFP